MAVKRDYYEVLGVGRSATPEDLKRAFRRLAMQYHPDRNQGDVNAAERFKECNEAYQVLSDPQKRRSYDMFGHSGVDPGAAASGFGDFEGFGFGDIFNTFFGAGGTRTRERSMRGDDLRYDLAVSFEEAFEGAEKEIDVPRLATCELCAGSGAEPGSRTETCTTC